MSVAIRSTIRSKNVTYSEYRSMTGWSIHVTDGDDYMSMMVVHHYGCSQRTVLRNITCPATFLPYPAWGCVWIGTGIYISKLKLFIFLLTKVIVNCFGYKRLLNDLNVNVNGSIFQEICNGNLPAQISVPFCITAGMWSGKRFTWSKPSSQQASPKAMLRTSLNPFVDLNGLMLFWWSDINTAYFDCKPASFSGMSGNWTSSEIMELWFHRVHGGRSEFCIERPLLDSPLTHCYSMCEREQEGNVPEPSCMWEYWKYLAVSEGLSQLFTRKYVWKWL